MELLQRIDAGLVLWFQTIHTPFLDWIVPAFSSLGNHGFIFVVLTIVLLIVPKSRKWGILMAFSLLANLFLCNILLKPMFARMRPFDALGYLPLVALPKDFSFPSGHTSAAFAVAAVLWQMDRRAGTAACLFGFLMGISRLYIGVHYPTDILIGALVGFFAAWNVLCVEKRRGSAVDRNR